MGGVNEIIFDKTGTITKNQLTISDIYVQERILQVHTQKSSKRTAIHKLKDNVKSELFDVLSISDSQR
jgi:P-type E1-E2 ATPase